MSIECREEQLMEVEVLESIYMHDFHKLGDDPLSYEIRIVPSQNGDENHVALTLKCLIPDTYPNQIPTLEICKTKGLSDTQYKELQGMLDMQVQGNLGMPMIYTICEAVREYLLQNNRLGNDGSEYEEMLRRLEKKQIQDCEAIAMEIQQSVNSTEEKKKEEARMGTPVTFASFTIWKTAFEKESLQIDRGMIKTEENAKLTGRQLWSQGLVKEDDEVLDDERVSDAEELSE